MISNKLFTMNATTKPSFNPWPLAIIAFFIGFFLFTVGLVVFASRQKIDLVRGDYYAEEIKFQEQIDRMNRAQAVQEQVAIQYEPSADSITITLPPDHAKHLSSGRIRLYRPSDENLDQELTLAPGAGGLQKLDAKKLRAGLWQVRVYWTVEGKEYFFGQSVVISGRVS